MMPSIGVRAGGAWPKFETDWDAALRFQHGACDSSAGLERPRRETHARSHEHRLHRMCVGSLSLSIKLRRTMWTRLVLSFGVWTILSALMSSCGARGALLQDHPVGRRDFANAPKDALLRLLELCNLIKDGCRRSL